MSLVREEPRVSAEIMKNILASQYDVQAESVIPLSEAQQSATTYCSNPFVVDGSHKGKKYLLLAKECLLTSLNSDAPYRTAKGDVVDFLIAQEVPVPRQARTTRGEAFGSYENRLIEVTDYFPGVRNYIFGNTSDVTAAADALARFDRALDTIAREKPHIYSTLRKREDPYDADRVAVNELLKNEVKITGKMLQTLEADAANRSYGFTKNHVDMFFWDVWMMRDISLPPQRTAMIHRDFHGNNIIYEDEGVHILDMDTLCVHDPLLDPAYSALFFSSNIKRPFDAPDQGLYRLFLETYWRARNAPEIQAETERMHGVLENEMTRRTVYFVIDRYLKGANWPDGVIGNHIGVHKRLRDIAQFGAQ